MFSRREFLKAAAALGSSSVVWGDVPDSIARAFAIDPSPGTTFLDAEHVVILMQENRSFDHAFGALRGVRGFRDPRVHRMPTGQKVWFQSDASGQIVPPFRMDMDGSNSTWIGGTPHSWPDQVDARNGGRYDKWLEAKARGDKFPMTMGYYAREDIPFYYALADAFTICDYAFCSSLTGTTPNRLYLWTGTIRESAKHPARVQNGDTDYDREAAWTTYPERLQDAGISWKIYQNEISLDTGLVGEQDAWLSNFTDNPIEWFTQYRVRFSEQRRQRVASLVEAVGRQVSDLENKLKDAADSDRAKLDVDLNKAKNRREALMAEQSVYTEAAWGSLSARDRALHERAFCDNRTDAGYRDLVKHAYQDKGVNREINVPKGDVLAQFREDVRGGKLPAVSWLVAPERFSDHPGSAWFGAWYLSEAMNILTEDPEIWKKTVFILCYDENDGFFDHIPPFIAPHPDRPETGKVSAGIDTSEDISKEHGRDHSIGLGYRCPMIIASPWTRGGCVNSQVCDHVSVLMFLESWLAGRGKPVREDNISDWRRTVCGDLTSAFRPYNGEKLELPKYLNRDDYVERIHKASFQGRPAGRSISASEMASFKIAEMQEEGTRPSCPLPYELEASIMIVESDARVNLAAGRVQFGAKAAGGAFNAYSYSPQFVSRAYAVKPGDSITDDLPVGDDVSVRIDGPNGFMRELISPRAIAFDAHLSGRGTTVFLTLKNRGATEIVVAISDGSYGQKIDPVRLGPNQTREVRVSVAKTGRWYDLIAKSGSTAYRFAGRIEDGTWSTTDPAMG